MSTAVWRAASRPASTATTPAWRVARMSTAAWRAPRSQLPLLLRPGPGPLRASSTLRAAKKEQREARLHVVEAMVSESDDKAAAAAALAPGVGAQLSPKERVLFSRYKHTSEHEANIGRALELLDQHPTLRFKERKFFDFPRRHSNAAVNPNYKEDNEDGLQLTEADKHTVAAATKGWYPGHQRYAERNMPMLLRKARAQTGRLPLVVEVRDARIPLTGINPVFEKMLQLPNPNDLLAVRAAAAARGELPFASVVEAMRALGIKYRPHARTLKDLDLEPVLPAAFARLVVYTRADLIDSRLRDALRQGIERKHAEFGLPKAYGQVMFVDTHNDDDIKPVVQWLRDRAKELSLIPSDVSNWFIPRTAKGAFRGANEPEWAIRAVALGMPNSGKSSLVNAVRRVGVNGSKAMTETNEFRGTQKVSTPVRVTGERRKYGFAKFHEGEHGKKALLDKLKFDRLPEAVKDERRTVPPVYIYDTPGINVPYIGAGTVALHRAMKLTLVGAIPNPNKDPQILAEYLLFKQNRQYRRQIELWRERQRLKIIAAPPKELARVLQAPEQELPRHLADAKNRAPAIPDADKGFTPQLAWDTGKKKNKNKTSQLGLPTAAPAIQQDSAADETPGKLTPSDGPAQAPAQTATPSRPSPPVAPETLSVSADLDAPAPQSDARDTEPRPKSTASLSPVPRPSSPMMPPGPVSATARVPAQQTTTITLDPPPVVPEPQIAATDQPAEAAAVDATPGQGQVKNEVSSAEEGEPNILTPEEEERKYKLSQLAPWMLSTNRELDLYLDRPPVPDYSKYFRFNRPPPPTNVISQYLTKLADYTPQGYVRGGYKHLDRAARHYVKRAMGGWMSCAELDMQPWDEVDAELRKKIQPRRRKLLTRVERKARAQEERDRFASLSKAEQQAEIQTKARVRKVELGLNRRVVLQMRKVVHERLDAHVYRELRRREEKRGRFRMDELEQAEYEGRHGVTPGEARGSAPGVPADVQARAAADALRPHQDTADKHGLVVSHASHGMPSDDRMTLAYDPGVSPKQLYKRWQKAKQRRNFRRALAKGYRLPLRTLRRAGMFKMTRAKRSTRVLRATSHTKPAAYY